MKHTLSEPYSAATSKRRSGSQDTVNAEQNQFKPNLDLDFRKVRSLYDIKDREALFYKVQYVIEHMDKDRYKKFRSGKLSMPQCIARIEAESKNGLKYKVLDDLKDELEPESLKKPT